MVVVPEQGQSCAGPNLNHGQRLTFCLGRYESKCWHEHSAASHLIRLDRMSHHDLADLFHVLEDEAAEVRVDIVVVLGGVVEAGVECRELMVLAFEQQQMYGCKEQVGESGFLFSTGS